MEIKATNATVANAAAISSNITAIANNNSDFPYQANSENNKFVEAINMPETNIALITPERIANNPPNRVKITVVIHAKPFAELFLTTSVSSSMIFLEYKKHRL